MNVHRLAVGALGLALASTPVISQAQETVKPLRWHIGASVNPTIDTTEDYLDNGWGLSGGLTLRPGAEIPVSLRAELHYSSYDATDELIQLGSEATQTRIDDGDADVFGGDVSGIYEFELTPRTRGYTQAGLGLFRREVSLEQTVLFDGLACDPWWGVCYPAVAAGSAVVAESSTTRLGWNAGIGVEVATNQGGIWFVDARYLRINTSEPTEFIPIRFGYRF